MVYLIQNGYAGIIGYLRPSSMDILKACGKRQKSHSMAKAYSLIFKDTALIKYAAIYDYGKGKGAMLPAYKFENSSFEGAVYYVSTMG